MLSEKFLCPNGVAMQYIEEGVEYSLNELTLQFVGEQAFGEVSIGNNPLVIGEYYRDEEDATVVELEDGRVFTLCSDEDYEDFALQMLT